MTIDKTKKCGIDPSLNGFCISVIQGDKLLDFLFIKTESYAGIMNRTLVIAWNLDQFLRKNKIKHVSIESPYFNKKNVKTYGDQQRLYQQVLYVLQMCGVTYDEYTPTEIKKALGPKIVSKEDVLKKFKTDLKISDTIKFGQLNKDEYEGLLDSIAIGRMLDAK